MESDHHPSADDNRFAAPRGTAQPAPPTPHGARPRERRALRPWLYVVGTLLVGMCSGQPEGGDSAEQLGNLVGNGIGTLAISVALVALVLVWRPSTRSRIPGAAFVVALLLALISLGEATREKEEQFAALQRLADSTVSPVHDSDPPPRDTDARILWVSRKAMEDLLVWSDTLARAHGVDADNPPSEWLSAAYLADARKHPEVGTYFTRYQAYVREADSAFVPALTERMRVRLAQSGLGPGHAQAFMLGVGDAIADNGERKRLAAALELTRHALALHAYLVSVDSRAHLDDAEEAALFERDEERLHVNALLERIERLGAEIEAQQRRRREGIRDIGESMGIPTDTVHPAPAPAETRGDRTSKS